MRKAGASLRLSSSLKCAENPHEIGLKYVGARLQAVRRADYLPFALYPRYCTGIFPFSRPGGRRPISVRAMILRGAFLSDGCAPFRNRRVSGRLFIEEIRFLPPFLLLRAGDVDLFVRIGILSGVEHHRREVIGVGVRSRTCSRLKWSLPRTFSDSERMSRSVQPGCDEMK